MISELNHLSVKFCTLLYNLEVVDYPGSYLFNMFSPLELVGLLHSVAVMYLLFSHPLAPRLPSQPRRHYRTFPVTRTQTRTQLSGRHSPFPQSLPGSFIRSPRLWSMPFTLH